MGRACQQVDKKRSGQVTLRVGSPISVYTTPKITTFIMKFAVSIITLYAAAALAGATERVEDIEPFEDAELSGNMEPFNATGFDDDEFSEDVFGLEKRRGCTGHRKTTDVCQGNFIAKMPSRHNWYANKQYFFFSPCSFL